MSLELRNLPQMPEGTQTLNVIIITYHPKDSMVSCKKKKQKALRVGIKESVIQGYITQLVVLGSLGFDQRSTSPWNLEHNLIDLFHGSNFANFSVILLTDRQMLAVKQPPRQM